MRHRAELLIGSLVMGLGIALGLAADSATLGKTGAVEYKNEAAAITETLRLFVDAYNRGDVPAMISIFSDDLVYMPEGLPTESGRPAIDRWASSVRDTLAKYKGHLDIKTEEIEVFGDMAFGRGSLTVTLTPIAEGQAVTRTRRFLEMWKKEKDGKWRIIRAMNNNLAPAPPPA